MDAKETSDTVQQYRMAIALFCALYKLLTQYKDSGLHISEIKRQCFDAVACVDTGEDKE